MIVLFSELSEGDIYFGATKLNKLLFFADFLSFLNYEASISGGEYEARPEGPMLRGFYDLRDQMTGKDIEVRPQDFRGYEQHKTFALRPANVAAFSSEEMGTIMRVLNEYRSMNASQISALSHEFLGWQAVDFGEVIPYETALVSTRELTLDEYEFPENITIKFENYGIDINSNME
jgi:uncharacterized phage-associated protein